MRNLPKGRGIGIGCGGFVSGASYMGIKIARRITS